MIKLTLESESQRHSQCFVGFVAYMGAAVAGYPLGKITQDWGWEGFFWSLVICCGISIIALLPLWHVKENLRPVTTEAVKA